MNTKQLRRIFFGILYCMIALILMLSISVVAHAESKSPFVGHWQAVDSDGSDINLTISGPPNGPYQITWTEDYLSFCDGGPGNIRGTGILNSSDSNILEAGLRLVCFTTSESITFELKFRYRPLTNTLISQYESNGPVIIWHRPGSQSAIPSMPTFVAYIPGAIEGYDWQLGDTIQININDGEYTAEAIVEEAPWDPNQTRVLFEIWRDDFYIEEGNFIVMTDGFITKEVSVTNLSITGFDLGAGTVTGNYDPAYGDPWVWLYDMDGQVPATDSDNGTWTATFAELPPGAWGGATQWDMDGDGTSIDFQVPMPVFVAYIPGAIEGYDWPMGDEIRLIINGVEYPETAFSEQRPDFPEGATRVLFEVWMHDISLQAGDQIVMTDEVSGFTKDVTVTNLAVTSFDLATSTVSGTYDPNYELWVWLEGQDWQAPEVDPDNGTWIMNFNELAPGTWGGAVQYDMEGDGTSIDFQVP